MSEDVRVVKLRNPYRGHRGLVTELRFRAPVYRDVMALGEPGMLVQTPDGSKFVQEAIGIIDEYAKRLLVDEDPLLMEGASITDTLRIKEAIQGFFYSAQTETAEKASTESSPQPS